MSLIDKLFRKNNAGKTTCDNEPVKEESGEKESMTGSDMLDQMFLKGFYSNESTFRNQVWHFPRFSKENPATLGETLSVLFEGIISAFKSLRIFFDGEVIKEERNPSSIARTQLFPLILGDGPEPKGNIATNVVLLVGLNGSIPVKEILLHLKGTYGIPGKCFCMRVSLLVPPATGEESFHCCRPGAEASIEGDYGQYSTSFLLMQDNCDMSATLREYEHCETAMRQKEQHDEELTELEKEISEGRWELKDPNHGIGYGKWLMTEERWFDAYRQLIRIFRTFQRFILNDTDTSERVKAYVNLAFDIGKCLHKMGRNDEAYYYLSLAADRLVEARQEYSELLAEMMDIRTSKSLYGVVENQRKLMFDETAQPYKPRNLSVGIMMRELFGAPEGSLTSIAVYRDDDAVVIKEDDARKTWDYPILSLVEDGITAVINYSPVTYITNDEADKSKLIPHHVAVLRVKKASGEEDGNLFRFYVMIPPATFDSDKQNASPENIPEGISFILGDVNNGWPEAVKPEEVWGFAHSLCKNYRFLEGFQAAKFAVDYYKTRWESLSNDEKGCFLNAVYIAGFCLMDFKYPEKACYYLSIAAETHSSQYVQEYINSLSNAHDLRTLSVIDNAISMGIEEGADAGAVERWRLFLKRRKAFILTDSQRFVEAEVLLQELLNSGDEVTSRFAASELQYVIEEKHKRGIR